MIAVIEPICKSFSHEKINSGFLTAIRYTYPNDAILVYAHRSHIEALNKILAHDNVNIKNISYVEILNGPNSGILSLFKYLYVFYKIFSDLDKKNINKIFFLSFSPAILFIIKQFKKLNKFSKFTFLLILHGIFEDIALKNSKNIIYKINKFNSFKDFLKIFYHIFLDILNYPSFLLTKYFLNFNNVFKYKHSNDFRYAALSQYIIDNAKEFLDVEYFNIHLIDFPNNFVNENEFIEGHHIKFGVFGYGNSKKLAQISKLLLEENINSNFEIKIIGMDNRGLSDYQFIKFTSNGKPLTRQEMERAAKDVDIFLILYESNKYRLSCSGSIFEALSYSKPIIHLANECIDYYNDINLPIGISCKTDIDLVITIKNFIENKDNIKKNLIEYKKNILVLRKKYHINNLIPQIKKAYTW
jgi:hypothetical protein